MMSDYTYGFSVLPDQKLQHEWTAGAFETITGYTTEELNSLGGWVKLIYHEDFPIIEQRHKKLLSGQESDDEFRIVTQSGQIRWIKDYGKPVWDEKENRVVYLFGAVQDLTERKLAEQQKLELATERKRIDILADFIAATSHEVRTPLSVINTSLYMLMRTNDETKRQQKADQISNQVKYLNNMINQLHEVVRLDQLHELKLIPLTLESSIKTFLDHYLAQNQGINLVSHIAPDLPLILGDRVYIDAMLTHLVNNAVHFSDEGTRIELNITLEDSMVALRVKDYGIGIAPEHLSQIFNPFYKVNMARTHGENGVGVGLTIVKRLMQLHHGRVDVQSKLDEGTVFTLYFPIAPSA